MAAQMTNETPSPAYELAVWAACYLQDLIAPADRPWYFGSPMPAKVGLAWEYKCHCGKEIVRVERQITDNPAVALWIGQCELCEAVIWTRRAVDPFEGDNYGS